MFICNYTGTALGGEVYHMKIIFAVDTYYPRQDGVQTVTQYLAEGLAQKGHEVLILTSLKEGLLRKEVHNAVTIERYVVSRNQYTLHFVGERKKINKRMKDYDADAIIFVSIGIWCFDWFRHRLNRYLGKKILYTHGFDLREYYSVWGEIKEIRICRQIVPLIMNVYSEVYRKGYKERLFKSFKYFDKTVYLYEKDNLYLYMKQLGLRNDIIIGNAVEDSFFERRAFEDSSDTEVLFINISSYVERKNQKLLLAAFYEAAVPDSRLILIGSKETPYYNQLLEFNHELKSKYTDFDTKVEILCGLSRVQIKEIYKKAHVYLSASSWEAMSTSLCEAAAAGLAIISTDVGHAATIPGVQLCKEQNEFSEKMKELRLNSTLRKECGKLAYEYAEKHYRIQMKVDELENILQ